MTSDETGSVDRGPPRRPRDRRASSTARTRHRLEPGEALLRVDTFALTANNVTYAVLGDFLQYWKFFPGSEEGWGRVPVWGFADVVASRAEGVEDGARLWGYLPMATHLVVQPARVGGGSLHGRRTAPRRAPRRLQPLPAAPTPTPATTPRTRPLQMLLRPLFATSFLIDDALADEGFGGADRVVLASASSKTAYGTAFMLAGREEVEVVGLTSRAATPTSCARSAATTEVLTYDEVGELAGGGKVAYVDMSGDGALRATRPPRARRRARLRPRGRRDAPRLDGRRGRAARSRADDVLRARARQAAQRRTGAPAVLQQRIGEAWVRFLGFVDARGRPGGDEHHARKRAGRGSGDVARARRRRRAARTRATCSRCTRTDGTCSPPRSASEAPGPGGEVRAVSA